MSGFRKAKAEQAALKVGMYGVPGSGKTFTALLCAEGLSKISKKRIAYVDTERGTDFYCKTVQERKIHPEAFDFDAIYTKSLTEVNDAVRSLNPSEHGIIIIDSMTHLWEAAKAAYSGKINGAGQIPFHAWSKIKKPYKDLINMLLSSSYHVFICGRQGNEFDEDESTGELKKVGTKMKAEGETAYEPHILIHMEAVRNVKTGIATITAFAEKDRTGILAGRTIENPSFDNLIKPLLSLLGDTQAKYQTDDETASQDAEKLSEEEDKKAKESANLLRVFSGKIMSCESSVQLEIIGKEITPDIKKQMTAQDVAELRSKFSEAQKVLG